MCVSVCERDGVVTGLIKLILQTAESLKAAQGRVRFETMRAACAGTRRSQEEEEENRSE